MEKEFFYEIGTWTLSLVLSCWNPTQAVEFRKSLSIERTEDNVFFVNIVFALICMKMDWTLTIK